MGRVSERHLRYRTKEQIVHDVAFVLSAPLAKGTKWAVLRDVAWVWTEFEGKYKGCRYWSKCARQQYLKSGSSGLRHEHIVPKDVVIKMLLNLSSPTPEKVQEVCEKFLIGTVVTMHEDAVLRVFLKIMPPAFDDPDSSDYHNPWLRYRLCNIEMDCEHAR